MRIVRDSVLKELGAARQVFYGINVMHYAIDGVSASGDHNNIFMAWHPRKNTAWIGPPQVFESAKLKCLRVNFGLHVTKSTPLRNQTRHEIDTSQIKHVTKSTPLRFHVMFLCMSRVFGQNIYAKISRKFTR